MIDQITVTYCICEEVLKTLQIQDDPQCKMSSAEVITFALMSALFYGCDYRRTRLIAIQHKYFSKILSHSRIVRRIHSIPEHVWILIFEAVKVLIMNKKNNLFIVDSFPVKAYENHKSFRARIFSGKKFHGYTASKKSYFFGIKVHMIVDTHGVPLEFSFTPGSSSDIKALQDFHFNSIKNAMIFADRAYTNYHFEDMLKETSSIVLIPKRRSNLKRKNSQEQEALLRMHRNKIETTFSSITRKLPRYICARTEKGFCLKVFFCILAYMLNRFYPSA